MSIKELEKLVKKLQEDLAPIKAERDQRIASEKARTEELKKRYMPHLDEREEVA